MESLLGPVGGYLQTAMVMMAAMSTGSGEVMSISSIIVYDIYKTYINPFRYISNGMLHHLKLFSTCTLTRKKFNI